MVMYSDSLQHPSVGGPSFGFLTEERQVQETSQHTANCHQPEQSYLLRYRAVESLLLSPTALWWRQWYLHLPHYKRRCWGPVHTTYSLCFIIDIYGEAKKIWLHRNKNALYSRFVSLRSVGELPPLTVTVQIKMLSLSVNEYCNYVVGVKRMRFAGEIFNLQHQTQQKTRLLQVPPVNNRHQMSCVRTCQVQVKKVEAALHLTV